MIQRSIRLVWRGVVLAFLVYLLFFVKLGERSTFGHLIRVMNTDEAQELGHEVGVATRRIAQQIGDQVEAAKARSELEAAATQAQEIARDELEEMVEDTIPADQVVERPGDTPNQ